MNLVRSLERRLESFIDGVAGRVFSGRLHPSEIAVRLAREADLARYDHETGPATGNSFTILINPRDLTQRPGDLENALAEEMARHAADEGLRLEGPIAVGVETTSDVAPGTVSCRVEVAPGPLAGWAKLVSGHEAIDVGPNRVIIGRAPESDLTLPHEEVSRRHALLWRQGGQIWIRDLGSSNGTTIDGIPVGNTPTTVSPGSVLGFGGHRYRVVER